ncbi:MAG TPA: diguanylate cyclase, partial [Acidimicrobiales bacterium]|nr:diguanylate cyclase [Acidimicrobiales bacterium]
AEEIRELVATSEPIAVNPPVHPRISVGVAGLRPTDDPQSLLAAARTALSQAKSSGRDRVSLAGRD